MSATAIFRRKIGVVCAVLLLAGCGVAPGPDLPPVSAARNAGTLQAAPGGLIERQSGLRIDFGRTEESTLPSVSRLLGSPPAALQINPECAAGPMRVASWPGAGLELYFQGADFRGWAAFRGELDVAGGLRVGDDRAKVVAAGGGIRPASLGEAFTLGGVNGRLDEKGRATTLWAGVICDVR